jgi:hypothetical protein
MHLAEPLSCTRLSQYVVFLYRLTPAKVNARDVYFGLLDGETREIAFAALDKREWKEMRISCQSTATMETYLGVHARERFAANLL